MTAESLPMKEDRSPTNATAGRLDRLSFLQRTGFVACRFEEDRDSQLKRRRCRRLSDLRLTIPSWPGSYLVPAGISGSSASFSTGGSEKSSGGTQPHDSKAERAKLRTVAKRA